jgi:hypothetical protein
MAEFESRLEPGIMLFTRLSAEADGQDMLAANQTSGSR